MDGLLTLFLCQNFLLLDEVRSRNFWPDLGEKQENSIEIEMLTCYWDKVNILSLKVSLQR